MIQAETTDEGTLALARKVVQREGVSGLFKGFWYNILLCINPAIQNTAFDRMKDAILALKKGSLTPFEAFALGAVAKAIATMVTYPLVRLKTILQAGKGLGDKADASAATAAPREAAKEHAGPVRKSSTSDLMRTLSIR